MNSKKVETWHGIIISTTLACVQKLRGLRKKLDALRVQSTPSPLKYEGFRKKTRPLKKVEIWHGSIISPT